MGLTGSRPKYHITARTAGGQNGTTVWTHSEDAFDRDYCERFAAYYAKHHPGVVITLTPQSGPCGLCTCFETGYRYWAWTDQVVFERQLADFPKNVDD